MAGFATEIIPEVKFASLSDSDMGAAVVSYMSKYIGFVYPPDYVRRLLIWAAVPITTQSPLPLHIYFPCHTRAPETTQCCIGCTSAVQTGDSPFYPSSTTASDVTTQPPLSVRIPSPSLTPPLPLS